MIEEGGKKGQEKGKVRRKEGMRKSKKERKELMK